jgi:hypothetical protein
LGSRTVVPKHDTKDKEEEQEEEEEEEGGGGIS